MPRSDKDLRLVENPAGRYVTIEEAAIEAGVVERTIHRWKKDGAVHVIRDRLGHIRVSLEDVMACRKEPSDSPLRTQVTQLQAEIVTLSHRVATLQHEMEELRRQQDLGEHLVHALSTTHGEAGEASAWSHLALLLNERRPRSSGGIAAMLAKRGLPLDGTCRLKTFAQDHAIPIHEIKKLSDAGVIGVTVYNRPGEHKRNKKEWWISPLEQENLIAYWQRHSIAYTSCPLCPHTGASNERASERVLTMK